MKRALLFALFAGIVSVAMAPSDADARRLGGGGSAGMQRSLPARPAPDALPAKPAAPTAAPATAGAAPAAAAAAPKRSWLGPVAGLAAGLGLAALMSHLGLGAEFANFLMIALLALAAFVVIRLVLRRFGPQPAARGPQGMQYAGAGAPLSANGSGGFNSPSLPTTGTSAAPLTAATTAAAVPAGFDTAAFERIAKMIFIRMQAANDAGNLDDLRNFTTPEMFAAARLELQERGAARQQTDVVRIDAKVLDVATEGAQQVVSVRFHGLIREETDGTAHDFDEVWHLVKPLDGSREWAIAGIQQMA